MGAFEDDVRERARVLGRRLSNGGHAAPASTEAARKLLEDDLSRAFVDRHLAAERERVLEAGAKALLTAFAEGQKRRQAFAAEEP